MQIAIFCAVIVSSVACLPLPYFYFPHFLIKGTIFGGGAGGSYWTKKYVLIHSTTYV